MNRIQEAIQSLTGVREVLEENAELQETLEAQESEFTSQYAELVEAVEHLDAQNALFQRQLEDIDYLNLFDSNEITEVVSSATRKHTIQRLRRLRQENPLAKQAVKLITRFTLGKGVELVIGPDPEKKQPLPPLTMDGVSPSGSPKPGANGLFPDNQPSKNGKSPTLPNRPRPQVAKEAVSNLPPQTGTQPINDLEDDALKEQIQSAWKDDDNQLALTSRSAMLEWIDNVATDGERFFVGFQSSAAPYLKLTSIPLEQIETIVYDPNNWRKPVYYKRSWIEKVFDGKSGQYVPKNGGAPTIKYYLDWRITEEELPDLQKRIQIQSKDLPDDYENVRIWHTYINPLWTQKGCRGISELYSSREWFRVYKEFMEDRAAINAAATSVAYKRKIKGGPTSVASMTGKFGGVKVGYDNPELGTETSRLARPSPGSTYDSNAAVDLEWMKTDTGAVNAKEDGRALLTAGGAGVGMFVHYFGDGGDANLATAQAMELPMVKTFEDWQQWTEDRLRELCLWIIREATDLENAKKQVDRIAGSFPPIISQDVVKYMTAWSQLTQNVASGNRVVKREAIKGALAVMDVANVDALMAEIDAEEVQLEQQRQAQHQAMVDALANNNLDNGSGNGNSNGDGKGLAARDGSSSSLPPDLKTIAKGKPPPARAGPKSA